MIALHFILKLFSGIGINHIVTNDCEIEEFISLTELAPFSADFCTINIDIFMIMYSYIVFLHLSVSSTSLLCLTW